MEGVLWKWTNYWNGWQTRWFILDYSSGVLSYYKSSEEVNQGCKGSVKVYVCQINVHSVDKTRLDLVIPGEQHLYLRAPSPQERQKWLVALGTAKACVDMNLADVKKYEYGDPNSIHHKKSELKLYCDLLMQQVHDIKSAGEADDGSQRKVMEEAASLLSVTCDSFIKTLEEIMKMSNSSAISASSPSAHEVVISATNMPKNAILSIGRTHSQLENSNVSHTHLIRSSSQDNR